MPTNKESFSIWECNFDINEIKIELRNLFKSPNPLNLYLNSAEVKEKFAKFINCLSEKIASWFSLNSQWEYGLVFYVYRNSGYDKIWINIIKEYLKECKNFDLLNYFYYVKTLNKDKQYLAKALLKIKKWDTKEQIENYLKKYNAWVSYEKAREIYDKFDIWNIQLEISMDENFIEHFLEKIYLSIGISERRIFLEYFSLNLYGNKQDFNEIVKIIFKIISSYQYNGKREKMLEYVEKEEFEVIKIRLDNLIENYGLHKRDFYVMVDNIINSDTKWNTVEKSIFWNYLKTVMIDKYYPEVKNIFYHHSGNVFLNKNTWNNLKWVMKMYNSPSPQTEFYQEQVKELWELKKLILELNNNLLSSFISPIVYNIVSEKIRVTKSDLHKLKYVLLFILADNYNEYKSMYMFFNQLEVFMNYNGNTPIIEKIKVSFSLIMLSFLVFFLSYLYLPIWVFIGMLLLLGMKYFEVFYPDIYYQGRWNIWFKFFAVLFLTISSYYWLQNTENIEQSTAHITKNVEILGTLPAREVISSWVEYIKTSILEIAGKK